MSQATDKTDPLARAMYTGSDRSNCQNVAIKELSQLDLRQVSAFFVSKTKWRSKV